MKFRVLLLVGLILLAVLSAVLFRQPPLADRIVVPQRDIEIAQARFAALHGREADESDISMALAEAAVAEEQWEDAARLFGFVPTSHATYGRSARHQQGQVLLRLNRAIEAEAQLREFIELELANPKSPDEHLVDAIQRLRSILEDELRFEERSELIRQMVLDGKGEAHDGVFYCFPNLLRWNGQDVISRLERYHAESSDNMWLRIALARYRTATGRTDEARGILEQCLAEQPDNLFVVAAQLELLKELSDWDAIQTIQSALPPPRVGDPWHLLRIRGHAANREGDYEAAIEFLELALMKDPANPECNSALGRAYRATGQTAEYERVAKRAQILARI